MTAEERLAKIFETGMSGKGSAVEALVEMTSLAGMSVQNVFSATIEEWCRITRTKNKKNARKYRDSLFGKGWFEVEGRRKTFKAGYTEDQITAAVEMMRGEVLESTCGEVLGSTPKEVPASTPAGTDEYPQKVLDSTPKEVPESTSPTADPSRARVSYTGEDNKYNNNNTTESDSQGAAAVVVDFEVLADRLHEAGGRALNRSLGALEAVTEPMAWIDAGADLDRDIIPTVRQLSKGRPANSINSWSYFTKAVAERREKRLGIAGEFKPEPVQQEVQTMTREEFANAEYL